MKVNQIVHKYLKGGSVQVFNVPVYPRPQESSSYNTSLGGEVRKR